MKGIRGVAQFSLDKALSQSVITVVNSLLSPHLIDSPMSLPFLLASRGHFSMSRIKLLYPLPDIPLEVVANE